MSGYDFSRIVSELWIVGFSRSPLSAAVSSHRSDGSARINKTAGGVSHRPFEPVLHYPSLLPASAVPATMVAAAPSPAVSASGFTVKVVAIAVEISIATDAALPAEPSVIAVHATVPMKVRTAVEVIAPIETPEAFAAAESLVIAAMEASPPVVISPACAVPVAPAVAIMEISPSVVVVEIDPSGIMKERVPVERRPIEPVEPRPRSDEHATHEPLRSVVAIWRTSVRSVWVVAVGAHRRRANIRRRAHSNRDSNAHLRVCRARHCSRKRDHKPHNCRVF